MKTLVLSQKSHLSRVGFSLVELMTVLVIIGVLAMIGMPLYSKYTENAKIAESYQIIDAIIKNQITYFSENNRFISLGWNPSVSLNGSATRLWLGPDESPSGPFWKAAGYPAPPGTYSYFSYTATAGVGATERYDEGLNEIIGGYDLNMALTGLDGVDGVLKAICTGGAWTDPRLSDPDFVNPNTVREAFSASNFGVRDDSPLSFQWVTVIAMGNLRPAGQTCRFVGTTLQSTNGGDPATTGGFVQMDYDFSGVE